MLGCILLHIKPFCKNISSVSFLCGQARGAFHLAFLQVSKCSAFCAQLPLFMSSTTTGTVTPFCIIVLRNTPIVFLQSNVRVAFDGD